MPAHRLTMTHGLRRSFARQARSRMQSHERQLQAACSDALDAWFSRLRQRAAMRSTITAAAPAPAAGGSSGLPPTGMLDSLLAGDPQPFLDLIDSMGPYWGNVVDDKVMPVYSRIMDQILASGLNDPRLASDLNDWRARWLDERRQSIVRVSDDITSILRTGLGYIAKSGGTSVSDAYTLSQALLSSHNPSWLAKAQLIARTETVGANNQGALTQAKAYASAENVPATKSWLATDDEKTREDHADVDGMTVGIHDDFEVGGVRMNGPGDNRGGAAQVCNCRCTMTYDYGDSGVQAAGAPPNQAAPADAPATSGGPAASEATSDDSTPKGAAIMLVASEADQARLAPQGEAADWPGAHCTMAYLDGQFSDDQLASLRDSLAAGSMSDALREGIPADAFATAHFNPDDPERDPCAVLIVQSAALDAYHTDVLNMLDELQIEPSTTFPIWIPHVAIAYNAEPDVISDDALGPMTFDQVVIGYGDQQIVAVDGRSDASGQTGGEPLTAATEVAVTAPAQAKVPLPYEPKPYMKGSDETRECPTCGLADSPDAIYCDQCGTKFPDDPPQPYAADPDETIKCPQCSKMNAADARFCDQDGYQLIGSTDVQEPGMTAAAPATDAAPPADAAPAPTTGAPENPEPQGVTWSGPIALLDVPSSDGRVIASAGLTFRTFPLPLSWQRESAEGHDGKVTVGRVLEAHTEGGTLMASGDFLDPMITFDAEQAMALVQAGMGLVSVDLAVLEEGWADVTGQPIDPVLWDGDPDDVVSVALGSEFGGVTIVDFPAFDGVRITLDDTADPDAVQETGEVLMPPMVDGTFAAATPDAPTINDAGDAVLMPDGSTIGVGDSISFPDGADAGSTLTGTVTAINADEQTVTVQPAATDGDTPPTRDVALTDLQPAEPAPAATQNGDTGTTASLLAAAEVRPYTAAYFRREEPDEPTPLTVIPETGEVFGHVAEWGECHIGKLMETGACVTAPESKAGYGYFHLTTLPTDEGPLAMGKITLGTGHAGPRASFAQTIEHYDNSGTTVAMVRVVDGKHGPWACGQLVHDLPVGRVEELMRSPLSGDWRVINGNLELCAALGVNVPGFPIRPVVGRSRDERVGQLSLVAAGVVQRHDTHGHTKIMLPSGRSIARADFDDLVASMAEALDRRGGIGTLPRGEKHAAALSVARKRLAEHKAAQLHEARVRAARLRLSASA